MAEIETQRLDGYRRLIDIARDLASTLDLDVLLYRIVIAAAEITDAEAGSILLYDGTARQLYFQVATNMDQPTMRGLSVPLEGSIAGWIVTNRKTVRTDDVHDDPRFFSDVEQTTGFPDPIPAGRAVDHQGKSGRCAGSIEQAQWQIHRRG